MGIDWEKGNKRDHKSKFLKLLKEKKRKEFFHTKLTRGKILEEKGWQTCPQCGGGRHPAFPICLNCKSNNISESSRVG